MSQFVFFNSWVNLNPSYEYILFDDDDIEDFVCENFPANVSSSFSKLTAGASKADFWRGLAILFPLFVLLPFVMEVWRVTHTHTHTHMYIL